jgi:hypothetical protein
MKILALVLCLVPTLCLAANVEYPEFAQFDARQAKLKATVAEIRSLYRGDHEFIAAFDAAQKKWEDYCAAMLKARFPAKKKQEEYGSVYEFAYVVVKTGMIDARIKELSLWTEGTEEGDVSKGSVKYTKELDEIRNRKKG